MGPLRFELRSEDPQSPRMARLPYGPALLLLAHFVYLSCYEKVNIPNRNFTDMAEQHAEPCIPTIFLISGFFLFLKIPFTAQKKRYVYMFQSGIMNYKG